MFQVGKYENASYRVSSKWSGLVKLDTCIHVVAAYSVFVWACYHGGIERTAPWVNFGFIDIMKLYLATYNQPVSQS